MITAFVGYCCGAVFMIRSNFFQKKTADIPKYPAVVILCLIVAIFLSIVVESCRKMCELKSKLPTDVKSCFSLSVFIKVYLYEYWKFLAFVYP